ICGAAVVVDLHRNRRHTVGVRSRGEGQSAGGRDRRLAAEQTVVVVADDEIQRLAALVTCALAEVGRPAQSRVRTGVLVDRNTIFREVTSLDVTEFEKRLVAWLLEPPSGQ